MSWLEGLKAVAACIVVLVLASLRAGVEDYLLVGAAIIAYAEAVKAGLR